MNLNKIKNHFKDDRGNRYDFEVEISTEGPTIEILKFHSLVMNDTVKIHPNSWLKKIIIDVILKLQKTESLEKDTL